MRTFLALILLCGAAFAATRPINAMVPGFNVSNTVEDLYCSNDLSKCLVGGYLGGLTTIHNSFDNEEWYVRPMNDESVIWSQFGNYPIPWQCSGGRNYACVTPDYGMILFDSKVFIVQYDPAETGELHNVRAVFSDDRLHAVVAGITEDNKLAVTQYNVPSHSKSAGMVVDIKATYHKVYDLPAGLPARPIVDFSNDNIGFYVTVPVYNVDIEYWATRSFTMSTGGTAALTKDYNTRTLVASADTLLVAASEETNNITVTYKGEDLVLHTDSVMRHVYAVTAATSLDGVVFAVSAATDEQEDGQIVLYRCHRDKKLFCDRLETIDPGLEITEASLLPTNFGGHLVLEAGAYMPRLVATYQAEVGHSAVVIGDFVSKCPALSQYYSQHECVPCSTLKGSEYCKNGEFADCGSGYRLNEDRTECIACSFLQHCDGTTAPATVSPARVSVFVLAIALVVGSIVTVVVLKKKQTTTGYEKLSGAEE